MLWVAVAYELPLVVSVERRRSGLVSSVCRTRLILVLKDTGSTAGAIRFGVWVRRCACAHLCSLSLLRLFGGSSTAVLLVTQTARSRVDVFGMISG